MSGRRERAHRGNGVPHLAAGCRRAATRLPRAGRLRVLCVQPLTATWRTTGVPRFLRCRCGARLCQCAFGPTREFLPGAIDRPLATKRCGAEHLLRSDSPPNAAVALQNSRQPTFGRSAFWRAFTRVSSENTKQNALACRLADFALDRCGLVEGSERPLLKGR